MFIGSLAVLSLVLGVAVAALLVGIAVGRRRDLRQTQMLDAVGEAVIAIDLSGRVTFWNPAAKRLYGWSAAEALGQPIFELTSTTDTRREQGRASTREFLANGKPATGRFSVHRRDRTEIIVLATATPMLDGRGRPTGYVAVVRDIADVVNAEAELRASEERLRLAMRATNDALWDWRADSNTIEWGEGIRSLYGGEPEPTIAWWKERIHPNDREAVLDAVRTALVDARATVMTREYRFGRSDGGWSTVVARGCIVRDERGRAVRVIGALADITEQRKMQQQLQQSARLTSLGRLAGGMAHEFNNVLMAIQPFADLLRRRRDDSTIDRAVDQITNAVQRGRRVTEEIMRFTRPAKPALKKMDLASWLASLRNELQALIAPVALVMDVPSHGLGVEGDASQLRQAMVNLVVNARDAMERRGMVVVTASEAGSEEAARHGVSGTADSWVHLTVRDEGPGISESDLPHLFEPLFTTKPSGTGLGLAITHTAIRQHGGAIDAESRPGEGATFHIFLPRVEIETVEQPLSGPRPLPRRVLVIEDDQDVAAGLAELLGAEGCEVVVAPTGAEGLLQVQKISPEVVILDVDLPDANGRELYDRIRGIAPSIPIVLTSGHVLGGDESHENIVFLQKPYGLEALLEAVDAAGV